MLNNVKLEHIYCVPMIFYFLYLKVPFHQKVNAVCLLDSMKMYQYNNFERLSSTMVTALIKLEIFF